MNAALIAKINEFITDNGNGEITGPVLNQVLRDMVNQSVAEVTYSGLSTLIANGQITPGTWYKITDRGDRGIFVAGVGSKAVNREGVRIMLCPKTYLAETLDGNVWKGVWKSAKTAAVGDLFIWGGQVWRNLTGTIGSSFEEGSLDSTNWQLISKTAFTNKEYAEVAISVSYDFANDWLEQQWIPGQLRVGIPWSIANGNFGGNYIDITDWNDNSTKYMNVHANIGVFNNADCGVFMNVTCMLISNNYGLQILGEIRASQSDFDNADVSGRIMDNHCKGIMTISGAGSISGINHPDDSYTHHTDDGTVLIQCNFGDSDEAVPGPLDEGNSAFVNMLLHQDVMLTELVAVGVGLTGEGASKIAFGLEVDDETYLVATSLASLNNGVKITVLGNKTTAAYRRFKVAAVDGDVTGGILKISAQYL